MKGGVEEAAKMLSGLSLKEQEKIIKEMVRKDPSLTKKIQENLTTIEDLVYLTPNMIRDLLRELPLATLGLALRVASPEVCQHITKNVSQNIGNDLMAIYKGPPQSLSKVEEARQKLLDIVRAKIAKGEIIIDRE